MPSVRAKPKEPLIVITFNPARLIDVTFIAQHVLDQQLLFEVWPRIKKHVDRADRELRKSMRAVAVELQRRERPEDSGHVLREGEYDVSSATNDGPDRQPDSTTRHSDEFLAIYFLAGVLNRALEQVDPNRLYRDRQRIPVTRGQHHEAPAVALLVRELKRLEECCPTINLDR
jgi:hypothetical protein